MSMNSRSAGGMMGLFVSLMILGVTVAASDDGATPSDVPATGVSASVSFSGGEFRSVEVLFSKRGGVDCFFLSSDAATPLGHLRIHCTTADGSGVEDLGPWGNPPEPLESDDFIRLVGDGGPKSIDIDLASRFEMRRGELYFVTVELDIWASAVVTEEANGIASVTFPYGLPEDEGREE